MGKPVLIFADSHHGSKKIAKVIEREGKASESRGEGKLDVYSSGDFWNNASNKSAPSDLKHAGNDAYAKGDKKAMGKHEKGWIEDKVLPFTRQSGEDFKKIKPYVTGGKVKGIMGNSDYIVNKIAPRYGGKSIRQILGGERSAVDISTDLGVNQSGDTTFVKVPHDIGIASKYKDDDYDTVKGKLEQDSKYQSKLSKLEDRVKKGEGKNVVVLVHEALSPERWYGKGTKKTKGRLPAALKAHYDLVLDRVTKAAEGKNINIFHGHLHEQNKKKYKYKGIDTMLLDIDDVVKYDSETGKYEVEKAA